MNGRPPAGEAQASPPPPRARRVSALKMVLLGVVILLCGMVIGSAATLFVARRAVVHAVLHPEEMPERAAERLGRRLDLSAEQQAQVEAILRQRLLALAYIRERFRPQIDRELDELREEVATVLDEEQARRWRDDFRRLRHLIQPQAAPAPEASPDELPSPPPQASTP